MLVAIVGPDGSGKSTQAALLTNYLHELGKDAILVRPVNWLQKKYPQKDLLIRLYQ